MLINYEMISSLLLSACYPIFLSRLPRLPLTLLPKHHYYRTMPYGYAYRSNRRRKEPEYYWVHDDIISRIERCACESSGYQAFCTDFLAKFLEPVYILALLSLLPLIGATYLLEPLVDRLLRHVRNRKRAALARQAACRKSLRRKRMESIREAPTKEQLLAAWEESRTSLAGKLRLGALLSEIEPHVDQSLIRDEGGHVVGRRPGIRGWIRLNCPELDPHYKAIMAYKALADKIQMAIHLPSKYSIVDVIETFKEFGEEKAAAGNAGEGGNTASGEAGKTYSGEAGKVDSESAAKNGNPELEAPKKALLEILRMLPKPTLRALDDVVRLQIGFPRMHRNGRRNVA